MSYGAVGSIIGHELNHGFDNNGRHFDDKGNIRKNWSNYTLASFKNITKCFIEQYNNYDDGVSKKYKCTVWNYMK